MRHALITHDGEPTGRYGAGMGSIARVVAAGECWWKYIVF